VIGNASTRKKSSRRSSCRAGGPLTSLRRRSNEGALRGIGTSKGVTTGIARVVKTLADVGRLSSGDILVCNSTDPGWTPVFSVVSALVMETGGRLAHGALFSREYGLPAVQLTDAMQRIPDGAAITVDGNTGLITIEAAQSLVGVGSDG
jgi:phosphoenolpyruvate synthase/pyruvate phosphate dikinase